MSLAALLTLSLLASLSGTSPALSRRAGVDDAMAPPGRALAKARSTPSGSALAPRNQRRAGAGASSRPAFSLAGPTHGTGAGRTRGDDAPSAGLAIDGSARGADAGHVRWTANEAAASCAARLFDGSERRPTHWTDDEDAACAGLAVAGPARSLRGGQPQPADVAPCTALASVASARTVTPDVVSQPADAATGGAATMAHDDGATAPETADDRAPQSADATSGPTSDATPPAPVATSPTVAGAAPGPGAPTAPPPAAPTTEAASAPPVLGPFRIGSPGRSLELGFATQFRFNLSGATGTAASANVELRRLRFSLRGALLDDRLHVLAQLNTTPASLELIDLWADWRFTDALHLRVGQFKTPFTRYRQQSFTTLALADWSVFASHFGAERQLGVMLHDGGGRDAHWVYQAGVFTGVNARASFARGLAALYGETMTNLSDLRSFHAPTEVHPAFIARVGHESAAVKSSVSSDAAGGGLRHAVNLSVAWDARPSYPVDFPLRLAPEALFKWNHVFVDVVAATGFFVGGDGAWGLASVGENVEVGWRFAPRWEVAARFSRVDDTQAARDDATARVAALVAAASPEQAQAIAARYARAGTPRWTQEVGAALNVYLVGDGLKWQTDVTWTRTDGPLHDEVRLRSQLQLAF